MSERKHDRPAAGHEGGVRVLTSAAELAAAEGQRVRVRGVAERQKLGTAIRLDGVDLLCRDLRFTGERAVELEGRLERWSPPVAEVGPRGQISQGVEPGTRQWILRDCVRR